MSLELRVIDFGVSSYADAWKLQQKLLDERTRDETQDTLLLAEHHPTISLGLNSKWNKLHSDSEEIEDMGIELVRSQRGGGAAYLGPGILVGYTVMNISPYGGVLPFMRLLEETMIKTASDFGIDVERHDSMNPTSDKPYRATWYTENEQKYVLCTKGIGLKIVGGSWYAHHGFALNVNRVEPTYFHLIDPCGFPESEVKPVSMSDVLGYSLDMKEVKSKVSDNLKNVLQTRRGVLAT